ncbi:MAG: hypothetical protein KC442_19015, partial [Thermomicrobiales bacterium]|nr:hypothetical protein [Thermomicrobiales bacterium]
MLTSHSPALVPSRDIVDIVDQSTLATLLAPQPGESSDTLAPWRVLLALAAAVAAVLLAPGELRHTVHLLLQGVCAQRPSHSLWLAG